MANITCPSCERTISNIATTCPFCGYNLKQYTTPEPTNYYREDQEYNTPSRPTEYTNQTDYSRQTDITRQTVDNRQTIDNRQTPSSEDTEQAFSRQTPFNKKRSIRRPRSGSAGRRMIGYRSGRFLNRCISMAYHLAIVLLLIWGYGFTSEYHKEGLAVMHIIRTTIGALILLLPALLLSDTAFHRSLPLIRSKSRQKVIIGFLLFLVPLVLLFAYTSYICGTL